MQKTSAQHAEARRPIKPAQGSMMPAPGAVRAGIVILLVAGAFVGGYLVATRRGSSRLLGGEGGAPTAAASKSAEKANPARDVTVIAVKPTVVDRMLEAPGTVRPTLEASLGTRVTGRVVSVLVREGDHVRRGEPLVKLDARDLTAAMTQADAQTRAAAVGFRSALVAARMEEATSRARIADAQARVQQSDAALAGAQARLDLVVSGPRGQERAQAGLAVEQAQSNLALAESNFRRYRALADEGAISQQQLDVVRTQFDVAKAQLDSAQQARSMTEEGSRQEEIRASRQAVRQAQADAVQARAGLSSARAAALQVDVRRQDVRVAQAQIGQAEAAARITRVARDYSLVAAPFDGVVTERLVDPGAMAAPGVPLLKVQGGPMRLEAVVPESALREIDLSDTGRPDRVVPVRLDAQGATVAGRIVETAPQGDPASHTYVVKVEIPSSGTGLRVRSGMFGRAVFRVGADERLLVPASAVRERDGLHYVYVVDSGGVARLRLVTVGDSLGGRVPVLSGLSTGERIVATGTETLADGVAVAGATREASR